jgi:hypothetical protein
MRVHLIGKIALGSKTVMWGKRRRPYWQRLAGELPGSDHDVV